MTAERSWLGGVRRKVNVGFGLALTILLVTGGMSFLSIRQQVATTARVAHTREVIGALHSLDAILAESESQQRLFVLVGDPEALARYREAAGRSEGRLADLRRLTADDADQRRRLDDLTPVVRERLAMLDSVVRLRETRGIGAAMAAVRGGRGARLMERIQAGLETMAGVESARVVEQAALAARRARWTTQIIAGGFLFAMAVVLTAVPLIHRDVAARREVERSLREREEQLEDFLEYAHDLIQSTAPDGRMLFVNRAWKRTLGYDDADLRTLSVVDILHPSCRDRCLEAFQRVLAGEAVFDIAADFVAKDGRVVSVLGSANARIEAGRPVATRAIFRDVTERKQAIKQLLESEDRYRSVVSALEEGVMLHGEGGVIQAVNTSAERILRQSRSQLVGRTMRDPWWTAVREDGSEFPREEHPALVTLRTGETCSSVVMGLPRPGGALTWISMSSRPLIRPGETTPYAVVVSFFDITIQKRAADDIARALDAAEQASRAKSDFLANMSHELRTPLNSIIGFSNLMLKNKDGRLTEKDLIFLESVVQNGKHLLGLINGLLDISKIEAGRMGAEMGAVDLNDLVRDTLEHFVEHRRPARVRLQAELPPAVRTIESDRAKLKQILVNLVGNALKFTEKGSVTVRVTTHAQDGRPVALEVIDTGIGIPRERHSGIFEAFRQADNSTARKYGGTGLGLTISRSLAQLLGCRLELESEPGEGSTFRLIFPDPEFARRRTDTKPIGGPVAAAEPGEVTAAPPRA